MPPSKDPVEPQQPDRPDPDKPDQDDAQIEEPKDDVFEEDRRDSSKV